MRRGGCSKGQKQAEVCLGVPGTVSPLVVVDVADNVKEVPEVHSIQADHTTQKCDIQAKPLGVRWATSETVILAGSCCFFRFWRWYLIVESHPSKKNIVFHLPAKTCKKNHKSQKKNHGDFSGADLHTTRRK